MNGAFFFYRWLTRIEVLVKQKYKKRDPRKETEESQKEFWERKDISYTEKKMYVTKSTIMADNFKNI